MAPGSVRGRPWWPPLALLLLGLALYLPAVWHLPLIRGEAMYALIPREMWASGDWLTPTLNGARYLDKPPLLYWLNLGAYTLLGPSDLAARLPTLGLALAEVWFTYLIGRRLLGPQAAWLGGFVLLTSVGFFVLHLQILTDHLVSLGLTAAVYVMVRREDAPDWRGALCFQGALAVGFMGKGFIGVAFPLLILAGYAWLRGSRALLRLALDPRGWLLFLLLTVPWFAAMEWAHPGFLRHQIINEQLLRFFGRRFPPDIIPFPLGQFWLFVFIWLLPWGVLLPEALYRFFRAPGGPDTPLPRARSLLVLWPAVVLGFFSLSQSRIEYYSLPALPALALITGWRLTQALEGGRDHWRVWPLLVMGILGLGTYLVLPTLEEIFVANRREFAGMTGILGPVARQVTLAVPLVALGGAAAAWRRPLLAAAGFGALALLLLFFTWKAYAVLSPLLSDKIPGDFLARQARAGDVVVMEAIEEFEYGASLAYYAGRRLLMVVRRGLPRFPYHVSPEENYLISPEQLRELWLGPSRVFLLVDQAIIPESYVLPEQLVLEIPGKRLFCNRSRPPVP
jgi:4-amino-4-deoxy-L-arabinose transferase-like glycosyltransferase